MKKTVKVRDIVSSIDALNKVASTAIPMQDALRISRDLEELNRVLELFNKRREAIVGDDPQKLNSKQRQKVAESIDKLLDEEVEVELETTMEALVAMDISVQPASIPPLQRLFSAVEAQDDA